ncbi:recombinase family protein [Haloimpatiens lingqiaonensis]|uniref:recombinase family protein n=1 Tax=Haloimpatiens lingqiaonensis TaxID=1380675 RepID=UPI001FAA726D
MYLSGYSVDMIMKELVTESIKSPTGKDKWSKRTIQRMITNEKYIGSVILGKTYTGAYPNNKQKVNMGEQEQFIMQDAHEPIISVEIFEKVQEEIKRRSNIEIVGGKDKRKSTHYSAKEREGRKD